MDQLIVIAALVAAVVAAVALVAVGVWFLFGILVRWPAKVGITNSPAQSFTLLAALLCVPVLWQWAIMLAGATISRAGEIIVRFSRLLDSCSEDCGSRLAYAFSEALSSTVSNIGGLLSNVPLGAYLAFLLLVILIDRLTAFAIDGSRGRTGGSLGRFLRSRALVIGTFVAVILFSFYLCLAALLAIPLMERQEVPEGHTVEDLDADLGKIALTKEAFDARFPVLAPEPLAEGLVNDWNALREANYSTITNNRASALSAFKSQDSAGLGGKETVRHYSDILQWFATEKRMIESYLDRCLGSVKAVIHGLTSGATYVDSSSAIQVCNGLRARYQPEVPTRQTRADALLLAGGWTKWLIAPESMPLIIIVGLLGFSFLGAALARIVKAGTSDRAILGWLSIPDLVVFIISGAAASLTVYAASYGGLAVLGDAGGNPNAYVVFTLCFAAALFSENVWDWLREILGRVTGDGADDQTEDPAPEEEDGDDAPVLTIIPDAVATAGADADYTMADLIKTPAERARNATRRKDKAKPADPDK